MAVLVDAHRGASATHPENTVAAFRAASTAGADSVELDLHLSRDGVAVVIHDATVERTTDGRGAVVDMALAELRALDAGAWKGDGHAGERIPTLDEALDVLAGWALVNLELKAEDPRLVEIVVRAVAARGLERHVRVASFHLAHLVAVKALLPALPTHYLLKGPLPGELLADNGRWIDSLGVAWRRIDAGLLAEAAHRGRTVWAWTVDDPDEAVRLARLGVVAVTTNDPATVGAALGRAGLR